MKLTAVEMTVWVRAQKTAPDFAVSMQRLGGGEYVVTDAKGRLWRCVIRHLVDNTKLGRGAAAPEWRLVPLYGPVEPEGRFEGSHEQDLIEDARRASLEGAA